MASAVLILFGTTPAFLCHVDGNLDVELDEFSLKLLKMKTASQPLVQSPASVLPTDEDLLRLLLYKTDDKANEAAINTFLDNDKEFLIVNDKMQALVQMWRYFGDQADFQILAEPFAIHG